MKNMRTKFRKTIVWVLPILFFLPFLVFSAGFVPCTGGAPGTSGACDFDSLVTMINSILTWLVSIAFVLAAIGLTVSGAKIVMSAGKPEELSSAKSMFWSIIKGIFFVAGAWLIVYTIMDLLSSDSDFLKFLQ